MHFIRETVEALEIPASDKEKIFAANNRRLRGVV